MIDMKVVVNRCFGGFSPSAELFEYLINKKGWKLTTFNEKGNYTDPKADIVEAKRDDKFSSIMPRYFFVHDRSDEELRSNKDLVEAVEKLGDRANTSVSNLEVVEIPDGIDFVIEEYDGNEHIAEVHRTW